MKPAAALAASLLLSACSTTTIDLSYSPALPPGARLAPAVSDVTVTDDRTEKDPTYLGSIRSGLGIPMKTLITTQPIGREVEMDVRTALQARGALASTGPLHLALRLTKLSVNQLVRRNAQAAFTLTLTDSGGRNVYTDAVDVQRVDGNLVTLDAGILASTQDLLTVMNQALTAAIDEALFKPGFAAALAAAKPG